MKLSSVFVTISSLLYIVSASDEIVKRDHGIPYNTLPSTTCAVPSTCSNVSGNVTCRCSETITTCVNSNGQYCWGSIALNQTTCPDIPTSCSSTLTGSSKNCLCNSQNILCVDNANNYCYGSIVSGTVSITAIPYAASSAASSVAPAANPTMSVLSAPSNTVVATPTATSAANKITKRDSMLALAFALVGYLSIH